MKPGTRLKSAVCDAEVMVIKATAGDDLTCGGVAMSESPEKGEANPEHMHGCVIGKRYVDEAGTVEVLCVKSGEGSIYYNGNELMTKDTKKLPSSD
ncbi:MAG: hypothetical protein KDI19_02770 [Pseudomonadales bacterium]|nr:hypothetical protein [Pseudomonadales bacterium]